MKKREMYIFMEKMEAIGDTWTLEEEHPGRGPCRQKRGYGDVL